MERARKLYRDLLAELVTFRSISTDEHFRNELEICSNWLVAVFKGTGFTVHKIEGYGNPIVVAGYDAGKPETCLIYGHYDVQPADVEDGWESDPFILTERDDRLFARGAVDNKGQIMMHIASILSLIEEGNLNFNIKFFIEGDEESDGSHLRSFIEVHQELLKCDFCIVSDGQGIGNDPAFETSMRGVFNREVRIQTADNDLHSGIYGGIVANSAHYAAKFIEKLSQVPSLLGRAYQPAITLPDFDVEAFKKQTGGSLIVNPKDVPYRLGFHPSYEVTGLSGGYAGEGFRNAIPGETTIKINFRVGPDQSAKECARKLDQWLKGTLCILLGDHGTFKVIAGTSEEDGVLLPATNNPYLSRARKVAEHVCNKRLYLRADGASIPVVRHMHQILGVPQVLLSLGNEDCNMHGVNENLTLVCMEQGLAISHMFLSSDTDL